MAVYYYIIHACFFREEHVIFDNKMQQDAQEMLRYLLTSLHDTALALQPSADLAPPISDGSQESDCAVSNNDDTVSFGGNASRKRKLLHLRSNRCKVSKTFGKSSPSCMKLTRFFASSNNPTSTEVPDNTKRKVKSQPSRKDSVKDIFEGELVSQTRCYECDSCTRRTELFLDISLAVSSQNLPGFACCSTPEKANQESPSHGARGRDYNRISDVGPFSLSWAISQFCLRENLSGENKYYCEECGHLVEAERSIMFGHLPVVMTFHLNRFTTHSLHGLYSVLSVSKIGGNIAVPLTLSFSTWCTQECQRKDQIYHLFAVVFHTGSSCSSGHYTSCVRGRECRSVAGPDIAKCVENDSDWVHFDDELVELITQQDLMDMLSPLTSSTAYILFYSVK